MKKKNINWVTIDNQIKNLKFPLSFIYNILKNQDKIEDYHLSLIIRFFLKNKTDLAIKYPLFGMFDILDNRFVITKKVINDFYSSITKKILFIDIILKFKNTYENYLFWKKDFYIQKTNLEQLLNVFKAHYDASINGINGVTKFISQLKFKNNLYINDEIKIRMNQSINLFGTNFFLKNNVKLITVEEYDNLNTENKIKFIIYFYCKVEKLLSVIINVYDLLIIYDNKIKEIINPKPIYINFNRIYSENDSDDINLLIND